MSASSSSAFPLDQQLAIAIQQALTGLSEQQLMWVSGYAAGLAAKSEAASTPAQQPRPRYAILYGSQTGNGEAIANRLAEQAREQGFDVELSSLADYRPTALKKESIASFIISTHGEGDPPDDAELFHEFLLSPRAEPLQSLSFNVLALGDSSYVNYCQTGREFDRRLAELGATRIAPLLECDVDYDESAGQWTADTLASIRQVLKPAPSVPHLRAVNSVPEFNRRRPFPAEILSRQKITGRDSSKDTYHIELSIEGSGLEYQPGDSLAIMPVNPPQLVEQILAQVGIDAGTQVVVDTTELTAQQAFENRLEITSLNVDFLRNWADQSASEELKRLLAADARDKLSEFLGSHQLIDVLQLHPAAVEAQAFTDSLRKLAPRSYSISSSPDASPGEVHLTVSAVHYEALGAERWGSASTFLCHRVEEGQTIPVFVEPNSRFRLPDDNDTPIIMIGAGTGVAPFRAFVEQRAEQGAKGRNWLIFGARNSSSDFLYQLEWQRHLKQGALERLDVAFSRDQDDKVYVQDRIRDNAATMRQWLDDGARIYVCGDAKRMAPGVHAALGDVLAGAPGVTPDEAPAHLQELQRSRRYLRDVY